MTFFFDTRDATTAISPVFSPGPKTGFVDNFLAGRHFQKTTENFMSDRQALADAYDDVVDAVRAQSDAPRVANPYRVGGAVRLKRGDDFVLFTEAELQADLWAIIADVRSGNPDALPGLPDSHDDLLERIAENARQAERDAEDTGARATLMGHVGRFLGHAEGWLEDPLQGATVVAAAPMRAGILATAGIEALLATAVEIPVQVKVQAYRKRLGMESGFRQGAENVAMAAGGAAVFGAGVKSILPAARLGARAGRVTAHEMRELLKTFDGLIRKPTGEQAAVRTAIEREAEIEETNPLSSAADRTGEHRSRLEAAMAAADDLSAPDMPERPLARPSLDVNPDGLLQPFRPDDLEVDAKLFQFKAGGDAHGVTERLRGVKRWDPVKSNLLVVYEQADGRRLVVDGHQRHGLARRIRFKDPTQDPVLYAYTFREADGVTPEEVRVIAALKNIGEGSGTVVDAAKVLRADPAKLTDLPPRSALVQQAGDMVQLADDVFGLIANDILAPGYGALIGRLIPDDYGMQRAVAKVVLDTEPDNLVQAESIIRQALDAGTHTAVQDTLFGPEVLTRSLFAERAKVLDKSIKGLRRDSRIFRTVVNNETDLAAAGNVLATDRNAARAATDEKTIQILTASANRKGPLSDALTVAARQYAETGRIGDAVRDFTAAVRDAAERGDLHGGSLGRPGRVEDVADETAPPRGPGTDRTDRAGDAASAGLDLEREQASLSGFEEPGGDGVVGQVDFLARDIQGGLARASVGASRTPFFDRLPETLQAAGIRIRDFVSEVVNNRARRNDSPPRSTVIGALDEQTAAKVVAVLRAQGKDADLPPGTDVGIDEDHARGIFDEHGAAGREAGQGQIPVTKDDFRLLPAIVADPDDIRVPEARGASRSLSNGVSFVKVIDGVEYDVVYELVTQARTRQRNTRTKTKRPVPRLDSVSLFKKPVKDGGGQSAAQLSDETPELRTENARSGSKGENSPGTSSTTGDTVAHRADEGEDITKQVTAGVRRVLDAVARGEGNVKETLARLSPAGAARVRKALEDGGVAIRFDLDNKPVVFNSDEGRKISKKHVGDNEKDPWNVPLAASDFDLIGDVLSLPDDVYIGRAQGKTRPATVVFEKIVDGRLKLVLEVRTSREELAILSYWKNTLDGESGGPRRGTVPSQEGPPIPLRPERLLTTTDNTVAQRSDEGEVPLGVEIDADGNASPRTVRESELLAEKAADEDFLDQLDLCSTPTRRTPQ